MIPPFLVTTHITKSNPSLEEEIEKQTTGDSHRIILDLISLILMIVFNAYLTSPTAAECSRDEAEGVCKIGRGESVLLETGSECE